MMSVDDQLKVLAQQIEISVEKTKRRIELLGLIAKTPEQFNYAFAEMKYRHTHNGSKLDRMIWRAVNAAAEVDGE